MSGNSILFALNILFDAMTMSLFCEEDLLLFTAGSCTVLCLAVNKLFDDV